MIKTYTIKIKMLNFDYLKNLNEKQLEAVSYLEGPLLIVAGAGSGKTKVLTSRIIHILKLTNQSRISTLPIQSKCFMT